MKQQEIEEQLKVLEILNNEIPAKYPQGSTIVFKETDPENKLFCCLWRDSAGDSFTKGSLVNIENDPEELQNINAETLNGVRAMFDKSIVLGVYNSIDSITGYAQ